jgi:hypothetical protein
MISAKLLHELKADTLWDRPIAVCCAMNPRDLNMMLVGYEGQFEHQHSLAHTRLTRTSNLQEE